MKRYYLIILVAIVGIIATIFIAHGISLIGPGRLYGHTVSSLENYRISLKLYHDDSGTYPTNLEQLNPKYRVYAWAPNIAYPTGWFSYDTHPMGTQIKYVSEFQPDDTGGFLYDNNPQSKDFGKIIINCTHVGYKGIPCSEM